MENDTEVSFNLQIKCHYVVLSLVIVFETYFRVPVIQCGYVRRRQDSDNWVCSPRTYRVTMAAGPPRPCVLGHLLYHNGGQGQTDGSYLERYPSSHAHAFVPLWFSFCRCLHFDLCYSQDPGQFRMQGCSDISSWVHHTILYFCFQCSYRTFPPGMMAYDCHVAIYNPLLYSVVMSNRLCTQLISISYATGFLHSLIHMSLLLTFCKSNIIHYLLWNFTTVQNFMQWPINAFMIFIFVVCIQISTLIIISYTHVLFNILKKKVWKGALRRVTRSKTVSKGNFKLFLSPFA